MKFKIHDRVRVVRSEMEAYLGLEGTIVSVHPDMASRTFNVYGLLMKDGTLLEFLEYQIEFVEMDS